MAEVVKVLYIMVVDEEEKIEEGKESFRYTRPVLQSTLQFMGCKARHAFKISQRVFQKIRDESSTDALLKEEQLMRVDASKRNPGDENSSSTRDDSEKPELSTHLDTEKDDRSKTVPFELYKRLTTVVVRRETFLNVVCNALTEYKYVGPNQRADLVLACRIRERKGSVTILLCGPSGCGKSTLSALLGSRLGITTVVSTDSIRHMMRSYVDEKQCPLLWASTYHAGEVLDPVAVADAKARRKARKLANVDNFPSKDQSSNDPGIMKLDIRAPNVDSVASEPLSQKQMAIEGFKAQSEMVIDGLDRLITVWEERRESVVVEGVHLSLNFVMGLMKKHPSIIPFMMYIANEDKHLERFAVRAKYMTLDPAKNRYVKYIKNIRTIQEYLCKQADKHLVPKINNTNIDKSVAAIHATVFSCLRRREAGERLYDPVRNTVSLVDEEYRNQCVANSLSSKGMFQLIQREGGSSRRLMALLNNDGSVARTWSIGMTDGNESNVVDHVKNGSEIGKAEPVNLCFGHFGISAWTTDDCSCSSHAGSLNEPKADGMEVGSKCYSSCCSSPSDGPAKELMEDHSVYGSDEEVDNMPDEDSDEDLSDGGDKHDPEEVGSVDEESFLSDEDYDDLALNLAKLDAQVGGYWANEEQEARDKYIQNLDRFLETVKELQVEPQRFCSSSLTEKGGKKVNNFGIAKTRRRSVSIPAFESSILSSSPMR